MRRVTGLVVGSAFILAGCGKKAPELPTAPIDRAAACSAIAAAGEQEAAGATGHISAAGQERVLHYALLEGTRDGSFDDAAGQAVIRRTKALFDQTIRGDWRALRPACAAAYPAAAVTTPTLPEKPADRALQCYALIAFMQKALGQYGSRYGDETTRMSVLNGTLDPIVGRAAKAEHLDAEAQKAAKAKALSAAAARGQPPAVIDACGKAID